MAPEEVMDALDTTQVSRWPRKAVPTGSLGLDIALQGGWPAGRISLLQGQPMTGKTLLAYHAAASVPLPGTVAWIDTGDFNPVRAQMTGLDLDRVAIGRLSHADQAIWAIRDAVAAGADLVVLDTASGLIVDDLPISEYAHEFGDMQRRVRRSDTAVLITNGHHMAPDAFTVMLKTISSVRVRMTKGEGSFLPWVTKNTRAVPHEHPIRFRVKDGRIDREHEAVALGLDTGVLHTRGSWIYFEDVKLGQGVLNAADTIRGSERVPWLQQAVVEALA